MRRRLCALALLAAPVQAQGEAERAAADAATRARVERAVAAGGFSGVYGMSAGTRRVAGGAVGEAAPGVPFGADAVFPWASVTKQVVAAMVMREVAAGRIALDAPASRYMAELKRGPRSPTVRELLQHRAGLPNPEDSAPDANGNPSFYTGGATGIEWCLRGRAAPGGAWRYNNCDYLLLGGILERVGGRPLGEMFQARVAGPLGISARFVGGAGDAAADANWAGGPDAGYRRALARYGSAGALVGTADDLLAFDRGLMSGAVVPEPERAQMWRGDPKLGFQALGQWSFEAALKGCAGPVRLIERRGAIGRFQVRNLIAPEQGVALVLLTNRGEFAFGEIWEGRGFSHDVLAAALCPA